MKSTTGESLGWTETELIWMTLSLTAEKFSLQLAQRIEFAGMENFSSFYYCGHGSSFKVSLWSFL